ncbi:MmcQ/YjbR family DNA-binding protein [Roseomonas sp. HJA6]|uniref:MmcQ/YjbR family DNA-binding protein n=1 Tax=Roseomonas alba TaxID=2846776 RepID=A0ABS7AH17_9PROT|nr:MmcQ/YjbR family DNA-binding protein [Neoroseomonas alba]
MSARAQSRLRAICLALPEAVEQETWEAPTWRIRGKIFCMWRPMEDGSGALWCKAPRGVQEMLVEADPDRFFRPPYVGPKGWIGLVLSGRVDWDEVAALVERSWRMTAPKRVSATLAKD